MNKADFPNDLDHDPRQELRDEMPKLTTHAFFLNAQGLRAGWSALLFIAIFLPADLLVGWLLHPLLQSAHRSGTMSAVTLGFAYIVEGVQISGALIATFAMSRVERRSPFSYGFQGRFRTVRFLSGLFYGFLAISFLVLVLWKAGLLSLDGRMLHGPALWADALGWAGFFLIVGLFEESLLRGYLQFTLTRGLGFWWGALLLSFLFGFIHGTNPGETPVGLFSAGAIGLVFCLSLWYTGSLWWALGFHAAWDWGESYFYGTSDSGMVMQGHLYAEHPVGKALWSGGSTGPEGSLLVIPLLAVITILMILWWRKRGETPFRNYAWRPMPAPEKSLKTPPFSSLELEEPQ